MTPAEHAAFLDALTARAAAEPGVLGVVATGSAAGTDRAPDGWSDHDVWIVVAPGAGEALRARWDWLPRPEAMALAFRETPHGARVLYDDGHLLEVAVFELSELHLAKVNAYRVLLDRADVTARLRDLRAETARWVAGAYNDDRWLLGQVLCLAWIAVGRHARGERLSAHALLTTHAVDHLVRLVARHLPPAHTAGGDDLDPRRRFEQRFPEVADRIHAALTVPVPEAARAIVALAAEATRPTLGPVVDRAVAALRVRLDAAENP